MNKKGPLESLPADAAITELDYGYYDEGSVCKPYKPISRFLPVEPKKEEEGAVGYASKNGDWMSNTSTKKLKKSLRMSVKEGPQYLDSHNILAKCNFLTYDEKFAKSEGLPYPQKHVQHSTPKQSEAMLAVNTKDNAQSQTDQTEPIKITASNDTMRIEYLEATVKQLQDEFQKQSSAWKATQNCVSNTTRIENLETLVCRMQEEWQAQSSVVQELKASEQATTRIDYLEATMIKIQAEFQMQRCALQKACDNDEMRIDKMKSTIMKMREEYQMIKRDLFVHHEFLHYSYQLERMREVNVILKELQKKVSSAKIISERNMSEFVLKYETNDHVFDIQPEQAQMLDRFPFTSEKREEKKMLPPIAEATNKDLIKVQANEVEEEILMPTTVLIKTVIAVEENEIEEKAPLLKTEVSKEAITNEVQENEPTPTTDATEDVITLEENKMLETEPTLKIEGCKEVITVEENEPSPTPAASEEVISLKENIDEETAETPKTEISTNIMLVAEKESTPTTEVSEDLIAEKSSVNIEQVGLFLIGLGIAFIDNEDINTPLVD